MRIRCPIGWWLIAVVNLCSACGTMRRLGWVRLEHISPSLQATLLAAEDKRFYEHGGVDWAAVAQEAWDNLKSQIR